MTEQLFSLLNVRSTDDLTASARIRDAAIKLWGEQGLDASVRAIAGEAGVSPGLVIHHYGSKDGLRHAVDEYVLDYIRSEKSQAITSSDPQVWLEAIDEVESFAPLTRYLLRSIQTGGEPGRELIRRSIDDAERYMEEGVQAGTIRPSRNPRARAEWISLGGIGALVTYMHLHDGEDLRTVLRRYCDHLLFPAIEVYTEGLMTSSTMLDAFVAQAQNPETKGAET